jgi:excisionase family DNA binding protein
VAKIYRHNFTKGVVGMIRKKRVTGIHPREVGKAESLAIQPRLLTIAAAAFYLSSTCWFVEEATRSGKIPSMILGQRRVIDVRQLDEWIEHEKVRQQSQQLSVAA